MAHSRIFALLGCVLVAESLFYRGWMLLSAWLGFNFIVLAWALAYRKHRVFGKRTDGVIPMSARLVFFPYFLFTWLVWPLIRLARRETPYHAIHEKLTAGRRLLAGECRETFDNYVDLTAEFSEPAAIRRAPGYVAFPILDASAPSPAALREFVRGLKPGRTFIHCAQGHGRTGLVALAVLLESGHAPDIGTGLQMLRAQRPGIELSKDQREC